MDSVSHEPGEETRKDGTTVDYKLASHAFDNPFARLERDRNLYSKVLMLMVYF